MVIMEILAEDRWKHLAIMEVGEEEEEEEEVERLQQVRESCNCIQ